MSIQDLSCGWYVFTNGDFFNGYLDRDEAEREAEEMAREFEQTAVVVFVANKIAPPDIDLDVYNGVRRGVDYPASMH